MTLILQVVRVKDIASEFHTVFEVALLYRRGPVRSVGIATEIRAGRAGIKSR